MRVRCPINEAAFSDRPSGQLGPGNIATIRQVEIGLQGERHNRPQGNRIGRAESIPSVYVPAFRCTAYRVSLYRVQSHRKTPY
jgi:hypothetical protein